MPRALAMEKLHAERVLEIADHLGNSGVRHAELSR
jgi:predicted Ser/Thr protein kinase